MLSQLHKWLFALRSLREGTPVMLLYVLESKGSSPGRQGFFMVVDSQGQMEGSIGGGIMEHKMVEMAKDHLHKQTDPNNPLRRQVHDPSIEKDKSGMICSGEQTILLYQLKRTEEKQIEDMVDSLEKHAPGSLVLRPGSLAFEPVPPNDPYHFSRSSENDWVYIEKTGYKQQLFIIGGGHCSLALSRIMSSMDFYIRVYEERPSLKTVIENTFAHEIHLIPNYGVLKDLIPAGSQHYVTIMTFGFRTDDLALRALKDKSFRYLGVMGSQKKMDTLVESYRREGFDEKFIASIHSPIGLQIRSKTPEEIAISIAAEIIGEKNKD